MNFLSTKLFIQLHWALLANGFYNQNPKLRGLGTLIITGFGNIINNVLELKYYR